MATNPTPFPDLNAVLAELVTGLQGILSENFLGAYLHGSFALGDFDADSDVDFLVVLQQEVSDSQLSNLQAMHARIYDIDIPWAKHLDGSYITGEALRRYDPTGEPLLYLDNGSRALIRSDHDNTLVVRWMLREHGVTLAGPDPRLLLDRVTAGDLRQEVLQTMRDWAAELRAEPERMNNRWYQPFVVLSYCRMLHTLHTGAIGSKTGGVQWAIGALDRRWEGLIQRAMQERPNPSLKVRQPADLDDFRSSLDFIAYAITVGHSP